MAEKKTSILNVPNALSLLRMILVPFFVWSLLAPGAFSVEGRILSAVIFAVTAFTDCLDGQIARRCNLVTNFGKFIDPLADKFMVFAALLVMVCRYTYLNPYLVWAAVIIFFRELAVTSIRLVAAGASGVVIAASWFGKLKTVSQIAGILVIILEPLLWPVYGSAISPASYVMMGVMVISTVASGVDYLRAYWPILKESN